MVWSVPKVKRKQANLKNDEAHIRHRLALSLGNLLTRTAHARKLSEIGWLNWIDQVVCANA